MQKSLIRNELVVGVIVLFIGASVVPSIAGYDKDVDKIDYMLNENETVHMKNDDYNNLIKQVIEKGVISNDDWFEQDKLLASDGAADDRFGNSVSIDGDYAIIGAEGDDDNGDNCGAAYVFKRNGTAWIQQEKLHASDGADSDCFGISVSIDGDYAIVGAPYNDDSGDFSGSAYIFKRNGTTWTQQSKLLASDGAADEWFGWSVSIDGDYAIVGARYDDDNGYRSGSAYIFKRNGTTWIQQEKLHASDGAADDRFGNSVSIDGDYAIVGAPYNDDDGDYSGSAYIFKRDGTTWMEQSKLLASDGAADDSFGWSVSIDGDYAIIGAYGDDRSGSAYIFKRNGTTWTQQSKLLASDGVAYDRFGNSVSIDSDYAIVGAPYNDENGDHSGSAYVFNRSGSTWTQQTKLLASDGAVNDFFGWSVSIDGDYAIIGAYGNDDNGENSGSAYVFGKLDPNAPDAPTITGEANGRVGVEYEYTFRSTDPNGDDVYYYIEWGDGHIEDWFGPYESGGEVIVSHSWDERGTYIIKARAKDTDELWGPWGELEVTMPVNQQNNHPFLQRFPLLYQLFIRVLEANPFDT